jgi:tetratricopeptide (TPR) repeat protein
LPTWHYIALLEGARAQVGVGRLDQGEALARACAQRYGRPEAVALHAQILWRLGDPAGAAAALQAGALGLLGWRDEVADAFVEVFRDPSRQAPSRMAFDAIVRAGATPEALVSFLEGVTKAGPPTLALDLWVRVPAYGGLVEALERTVQQFLLRRRIEGVNAAEDWLREAVEPARRAPLSVVLFEHGEHALLWSHAEAPDDRFGDNVWLLRAAAALRTTLPTADAQALTAHYRTAGHGVYHTLGEHLSGLEVFPRLRAEAEDPTTAGEAAYWIGYRAQAEGRYAEASDWYQVAILVGNARKHEWRWAFNELQGWSTRNRTLARLQQERFWIRAPPSEAP